MPSRGCQGGASLLVRDKPGGALRDVLNLLQETFQKGKKTREGDLKE